MRNNKTISQPLFSVTAIEIENEIALSETFDEQNFLKEIEELEAMMRHDALPLDEFLSEAPELNHTYFLSQNKQS